MIKSVDDPGLSDRVSLEPSFLAVLPDDDSDRTLTDKKYDPDSNVAVLMIERYGECFS